MYIIIIIYYIIILLLMDNNNNNNNNTNSRLVGEPIRRGHVARRFARISAHDWIGSTSPRSSRLANGGHVHAHQEAEQETLPQHSHPEPTRAKD